MCEYCGCQALTAIATLTQEHDSALDHVRTAERGLQTSSDGAVRTACTALRELLRLHTLVEEGALFPPLRDEFPDQIAALHRQHQQIDAALDEATSTRHADGWQDRLATALQVLRNHILAEQDGVFPAALGTLSTSQWEEVESVRASYVASPTVRPGAATEVMGD